MLHAFDEEISLSGEPFAPAASVNMAFAPPPLYGYGDVRQTMGPSLGPYGSYAFSQQVFRQLDYGYPPVSMPMRFAGGMERRLDGYQRMGVLDLDDVFGVGAGVRSRPGMSGETQREVEERRDPEGHLQGRLQERPLESLKPLEPLEPLKPLEPLEPLEPMEQLKPLKPMEPLESLKPIDPVKSTESNNVPEQRPKETKKTQGKNVVQENKSITKKNPIPDPATLPKIKISGSIKPRILYLKKK